MLRGEDVTHSFGGLTAVSHVDFHVERGEIVGLIGPNGAGKTTLFNLISGALTPEKGRITFKDQDITRLKP
ncbi:MAG: ATP-binding cassette domain-containing protein, partial [Anaerolineales bacterium]|nr:ATP-binding cassette domain-containing protein [Anaerolineales bacterium]